MRKGQRRQNAVAGVLHIKRVLIAGLAGRKIVVQGNQVVQTERFHDFRIFAVLTGGLVFRSPDRQLGGGRTEMEPFAVELEIAAVDFKFPEAELLRIEGVHGFAPRVPQGDDRPIGVLRSVGIPELRIGPGGLEKNPLPGNGEKEGGAKGFHGLIPVQNHGLQRVGARNDVLQTDVAGDCPIADGGDQVKVADARPRGSRMQIDVAGDAAADDLLLEPADPVRRIERNGFRIFHSRRDKNRQFMPSSGDEFSGQIHPSAGEVELAGLFPVDKELSAGLDPGQFQLDLPAFPVRGNLHGPPVPDMIQLFPVDLRFRSGRMIEILRSSGLFPSVVSGPDSGNLEKIRIFVCFRCGIRRRRVHRPDLPDRVQAESIPERIAKSFRILQIPELRRGGKTGTGIGLLRLLPCPERLNGQIPELRNAGFPEIGRIDRQPDRSFGNFIDSGTAGPVGVPAHAEHLRPFADRFAVRSVEAHCQTSALPGLGAGKQILHPHFHIQTEKFPVRTNGNASMTGASMRNAHREFSVLDRKSRPAVRPDVLRTVRRQKISRGKCEKKRKQGQNL